MRELKFRAWYKHPEKNENGVMLCVGDDYGTTHPLDCCRYAMDGQPVTLMQYTGLKDKNGVEIYEGDILKDTFFDIYGKVYWNKNTARFCCDELRFGGDEPCFIVGNIHENPELLG